MITDMDDENNRDYDYWQEQDQALGRVGSQTVEEASNIENVSKVEWQAPEYTNNKKGISWYFGLVIVTAIFISLAILVLKSWTFAILIIVMALVAVVYTRRQPGYIDYTLTDRKLTINNHEYSVADFCSYNISHDGGMYYASLVSRKRFMPLVVLYFPEDKGNAIVSILGKLLPVEPTKQSLVDIFAQMLKF
jgi:hypothetical protein